MRSGSWAIRVRSEHYEAAAAQIRPDDHGLITGPVFELKGFPEYMCEDGVGEFLGEANPLLEVRGSTKYGWGESRRRKFLVKVSIPIVWEHRQGESYLVSCKLAPPRNSKKPTTRPTFTFIVLAKHSAFPKLPGSTPANNSPTTTTTTTGMFAPSIFR